MNVELFFFLSLATTKACAGSRLPFVCCSASFEYGSCYDRYSPAT